MRNDLTSLTFCPISFFTRSTPRQVQPSIASILAVKRLSTTPSLAVTWKWLEFSSTKVPTSPSKTKTIALLSTSPTTTRCDGCCPRLETEWNVELDADYGKVERETRVKERMFGSLRSFTIYNSLFLAVGDNFQVVSILIA